MLSEDMEDGAGHIVEEWLEPGSLNAAVTEILQESMEEDSVTPADITASGTAANGSTAADNDTADNVTSADGSTAADNGTSDNVTSAGSTTPDTGENNTVSDRTEKNTTGGETASDGEETSETENNARYNMEQMKVENQKEGGRYTEILPGIDIQYIINSVNIKENIIVKNKEAAGNDITLRISHPGMVLTEEEDGSITMRADETSEKVLYRFMAPYMFDSAGAYSEEVEYILAKESEDTTLLTVRADKEWLLSAEREYPVTIDPITQTTQNSTTIADTFLREQGAAGDNQTICVGKNHNYGICRGLVKFTSLPQLDRNALIYRAEFNLYQYGYTADSLSHFAVTAHEVTAGWDESITMLSQQPSYDGIIALDYIDVMESSNNMFRKFDITSLVRSGIKVITTEYC